MAVTSTTRLSSYTGTGATTAYPTGFYFLANEDLVVKVAGVTKTLGADYTVTGAGNQAGGTVTFTVAPASGAAITIERTVALTQDTAFRSLGFFSPSVHEDAFDRLTMADQQQQALLDPLTATDLPGRVASLEAGDTTQNASLANLDSRLGTLELTSQFSSVSHTGGVGPEMMVSGVAPASSVHLWQVEAVTPGAVDSAIPMRWREDGGAWQTGLIASRTPAQLGSTGVYACWPGGGTIGSGDIYSFASNGVPTTVVRTDAENTVAPSLGPDATALTCTGLGRGHAILASMDAGALGAAVSAMGQAGAGGDFGSVSGDAIISRGTLSFVSGGLAFSDATTQNTAASTVVAGTLSSFSGAGVGGTVKRTQVGLVQAQVTALPTASFASGATLGTISEATHRPAVEWDGCAWANISGTWSLVRATISAAGNVAVEAALGSGDQVSLTAVYLGP